MKNATVNPPFKWTGGKNRMRDKYRPIFFPNGDVKVFVDMFCGACSISLWIAENYPDCKIILTDANKELVELYRVFKEEYEPFEQHYEKNVADYLLLNDYEERKKFYNGLLREYCFNYEQHPTWVNAANLFFMMRVNFNGIWKNYIKWNRRYSTPPGTLTQKKSFFNIQDVRDFKKFLDRCELHCQDFGALTQWQQEGTYYYADPPYRDSIVEYKDAFSEQDQIRLADFLKDVDQKGCWFSESNKEIGDGFWETHFNDARFKKNYMTAKYTAGRGKSVLDVKEVLVTNF